MRELPAIYRDPALYDRIASFTAPADLPFYRRIAARHGAPLLELGCGTGRIALPLAAEGYEVVGLELSSALLEHARAKATAASIDLQLIEGDFCDFDLGRRFATILMPYNAFNHLMDLRQLRALIACVKRHLAPDGRFIVDTFQPSPSFLANDGGGTLRIGEFDEPAGGGRVVMTERNRYEPATQINHISWHYRIDGVEDARIDRLAMRLYFPRELDALLELCGLRVEHKYGDYDERPFDSRSPKQLMVCRSESSGTAADD